MSEHKGQEPQHDLTPEQQIFFDKKMNIVKEHFGDKQERGLFSDVMNNWAFLNSYESDDFDDVSVLQELVPQKNYHEAVTGRFDPDRAAWKSKKIPEHIIDDQIKQMISFVMKKSKEELVQEYNALANEFNAELPAMKQDILKGGKLRVQAVAKLKNYVVRAQDIIYKTEE